MDRTQKGHLDEQLNLRCFYLRLVKKIWLIPLFAVIGALISGGIYTLATVTFGPSRTYKSESKLFISFAYNEKTGTMVDNYNAYTWNMFMSTDDILNPIISNLESDGIEVVDDASQSAEGQTFLTRQEIIDSITAEIPSDVRVMLLTTRHKDPAMADAIMSAGVRSLEHFGKINEAFDSIRTLSIEKAKLEVYTDRSLAAVIFGAVMGVTFIILYLLLVSALELRYQIPVLGVISDKATDDFFRNELLASFNKAMEGKTEVALISSDSYDEKKSAMDLENLKKTLGEQAISKDLKLIPLSVPGKVLDNYRKIGTSDGVILFVPYGVKMGSMTEHIITQLKKHDCPVLGIILSRADLKFMKKYYRI